MNQNEPTTREKANRRPTFHELLASYLMLKGATFVDDVLVLSGADDKAFHLFPDNLGGARCIFVHPDGHYESYNLVFGVSDSAVVFSTSNLGDLLDAGDVYEVYQFWNVVERFLEL